MRNSSDVLSKYDLSGCSLIAWLPEHFPMSTNARSSTTRFGIAYGLCLSVLIRKPRPPLSFVLLPLALIVPG